MPAPPAAPAPPDVDAVRHFNRVYTRAIGVLDEGHLRSAFSLAEVRVLYELAHRDGPSATDVGRALALDAGYLSRLLGRLERLGFVSRAPAPGDARRQHLALTAAGRDAVAELEGRARAEVAGLLARVAAPAVPRLLAAMRDIERALGPALAGPPPAERGTPPNVVSPNATAPNVRAPDAERGWSLRGPRPGDYGWVVERHGAVYAAEYGWDARFEALAARIVADYVDGLEPARERCWIAERGGADGAPERAGCVFLVRHPERAGVARLRLLLVEPAARGLGVGAALVDACTAFARGAGYRAITLWTNSVLGSARRIYEGAGYRLVDEAPHHSFGRDLVGQTWELAL